MRSTSPSKVTKPQPWRPTCRPLKCCNFSRGILDSSARDGFIQYSPGFGSTTAGASVGSFIFEMTLSVSRSSGTTASSFPRTCSICGGAEEAPFTSFPRREDRKNPCSSALGSGPSASVRTKAPLPPFIEVSCVPPVVSLSKLTRFFNLFGCSEGTVVFVVSPFTVPLTTPFALL